MLYRGIFYQLVYIKKGEPPTRVLLFSSLRELNSPLLRLLKHKGVSPVATGDQGSAFGNRKPLKRLDLNF